MKKRARNFPVDQGFLSRRRSAAVGQKQFLHRCSLNVAVKLYRQRIKIGRH